MRKQLAGAKKHARPWHGWGAVVMVLLIVLGEEACQSSDALGPEPGPSFSATPEVSERVEAVNQYDGPEYALPSGPKDFNDLLAQAAAKVPGGFGGAYRDGNDVVVLVKDLSRSSEALDSLLAMQSSDVKSYHRVTASNVRFERALHDWRDLNRWFKIAATHWQAGVVLMDIDDRTNRVYVGVARASMIGPLRMRIESAGVPANALEIGVESPIIPAIGSPTQSNVDLDDTVDPPYYAGFKAEGASTDGPCTMGPIVRMGSKRGYLTASHCTQRIFGDDSGDHYQATINDNKIGTEYDDEGSTWAEPCDRTARCRLSDAAIIEFDDPTDGAAYGHIARIRSLGSTQLTTEPDDEWLIADADPACPFGLVETSCFPAVVGTELQYVGYVSGWQEGTVARTCALTGYVINGIGYQIRCSDIVDGTTTGGNSGAAVFELTSDDREVNLWGILHGRTEDGTGWTVSRIEGIRADLRSFNVYADLITY